MNRISDSSGRNGGPKDRPSFKSPLCEIKSLKEKKQVFCLHLGEGKGRSKPNTKGASGFPQEHTVNGILVSGKLGGGSGEAPPPPTPSLPNAGDSKG